MKQLLSVLLSALLLLSLAACGVTDKLSDAVADKIIENIRPGTNSGSAADPAAAQKGAELAKDLGLEDGGWIAADSETTPYGQYRSVEEWEAIFDGQADYDNAPAPVEAEPPAPVAIEGAEGGYTGGTKTITFDETKLGEDTGVEVWDWKAEMTPEELAEYEEFENTDWEAMIAEMEAEANRSSDEIDTQPGEMPDMEDIQQQIDEALEGVELPEGFEQYLPGDFDLGSLLGN